MLHDRLCDQFAYADGVLIDHVLQQCAPHARRPKAFQVHGNLVLSMIAVGVGGKISADFISHLYQFFYFHTQFLGNDECFRMAIGCTAAAARKTDQRDTATAGQTHGQAGRRRDRGKR